MYLYHNPRNPNAHLTAKERDKPSYPTRLLFRKKVLKGKILDFGCGFGKDVEFLRNQNFEIQGYDPHYFSTYPTEKFDTIICHYVLNVLSLKEQTYVLMAISELLKPTGKAYFTVRRDLKKDGFRTHFIHKVPTYQRTVRLNLKSYFKNEFCEIYEYQHFNQKERILVKCPICYQNPKEKLLTETATFYAIQTGKSVKIISKRHAATYFDLVDKERMAFSIILERCVFLLKLDNYQVTFGGVPNQKHFYAKLKNKSI